MAPGILTFYSRICILLVNGININKTVMIIWQLSLTTSGICYLKKVAEVLRDRTDVSCSYVSFFYVSLSDRSKDRAEEKPQILKMSEGKW